MKFTTLIAAGVAALAAAVEVTLVREAVLTVNKYHYGNPRTGCMSDEMNVTVQGLTGDFCSPQCDASSNCPTDYPPGVASSTAGQCVLDVNGGANPTYCALICDPSNKGSCGRASTCEPIQGTGVCTYKI